VEKSANVKIVSAKIVKKIVIVAVAVVVNVVINKYDKTKASSLS
jgi:hypothetical protein